MTHPTLTAKNHFDQDIMRARSILMHAKTLPRDEILTLDLLRSAWMFAVGAFDAYACDKYAAIVGAFLILQERLKNSDSKLSKAKGIPPDILKKISIPADFVFKGNLQRENWRWRLASRAMMERKSVLSLEEVKKLFNQFLPEKKKLFSDVIYDWVNNPSCSAYFISDFKGEFLAKYSIPKESKKDLRAKACEMLSKRFESIFQRRHDCIHQCDRRQYALNKDKMQHSSVRNVINDIAYLGIRLDMHIQSQTGILLARYGFDAQSRQSVGF